MSPTRFRAVVVEACLLPVGATSCACDYPTVFTHCIQVRLSFWIDIMTECYRDVNLILYPWIDMDEHSGHLKVLVNESLPKRDKAGGGPPGMTWMKMLTT